MQKKSIYTHKAMSMDVSAAKHDPSMYYKAENMRTNSDVNNVLGAYEILKGNKLRTEVPVIQTITTPSDGYKGYFRYLINGVEVGRTYFNDETLYGIPWQSSLKIIGGTTLRDKLVLFTTAEEGEPDDFSVGQVWTVDMSNPDNPIWDLRYNNYVGFSILHPVRRAVARYENQAIQKVYWTDFNNPLRYLNLVGDSIDTPVGLLDNSPDVVLNSPIIDNVTDGGSFKAGVVQYIYALYNTNGSASKGSGFSRLATLSLNGRGAALDEVTGKAVNIRINDIDQNFDNIKIYRVFYTSLEQTPTVSLIVDEAVSSPTLQFRDDGANEIAASSIEEILLGLGTDPLIVKDLATKDNSMFLFNIKERKFDIDFDARAFRWNSSGDCRIQDNTQADIVLTSIGDIDNIPDEYDCINPSNSVDAPDNRSGWTSPTYYEEFIYQQNGTILGAEGKYVSVEIITRDRYPLDNYNTVELDKTAGSLLNPALYQYKSLKRDEIYRIGIRFVNDKGQRSFPKWICDMRMPNQHRLPAVKSIGGDIIFYDLGLKVTLKGAGLAQLPSDIVGYEILRVERDNANKTIVAQGVVNATQKPGDSVVDHGVVNDRLQPDYLTRTWHNAELHPQYQVRFKDNNGMDDEIGDADATYMNTRTLNFFSPELQYDHTGVEVRPGDKLSIVAGSYNFFSKSWWYDTDNDNIWAASTSTVANRSYGVWYHRGNFNPSGDFLIANIGANGAQRNYKSIARKGGAFDSNQAATIPIVGTPYIAAEGEEGFSYDLAGFGTINGRNDMLVEQQPDGTSARAYLYGNNAKCAWFTIGFTIGTDGIDQSLAKGPGGAALINRESVAKFIIADIKRSLPNQYGGNTYEARERNTYLVVSDMTPISTPSIDVFSGDTFISYYNMIRSFPVSVESFEYSTSYRETLLIPVETSVNLDLRINNDEDKDAQLSSLDQVYESSGDYYDYNPVYAQDNKDYVAVSPGYTFQEIEEFDNRVKGSLAKINGELLDSWLTYTANDYIDVEGIYGPIQAAAEFNDTIFVFQDQGICTLAINPNATVSSGEGITTYLGKGQLLHDHQYISTTSGTLNQYSVLKTRVGIYYYDTLNFKIAQISSQGEQPISDIKGLHTFVKRNIDKNSILTDNPFIGKGVVFGYDRDMMDIHMSFIDLKDTVISGEFGDTVVQIPKKYSVIYNELLGGFMTFKSGHPSFYLPSYRGTLMEVDPTSTQLWEANAGLYGTFFGTTYASSFTYVFNPDPTISKMFTNLILFNNAKDASGNDIYTRTFDTIELYNEFQTSGIVSLTNRRNIVRKLREWRVNLPREAGTRNDIRGEYAYCTLRFENDGATNLIGNDTTLTYLVKTASYI